MIPTSQPSPPTAHALRSLLGHTSGLLGLAFLAILVVIAAFAPWIVPVDPLLQNPDLKFLPPVWSHAGQWPHVLGTDVLGRDLLSRLIFGARLSLMVGFISVLVGASVGVPLGMIAGYGGGLLDACIMRCLEMILAFPSVLLAVSIVAILGPSLENAMLALGLISIPTYARVVRASVMTEKERDYVQADIALGQKHVAVVLRTLFPNVLSPLLVVATLSFAGAVLEAAGLSFVGLGAQPPTPEWGALLFEGKTYMFNAPWLILFPGIAILTTVMSLNLLGDALRDVFDPKAKQR